MYGSESPSGGHRLPLPLHSELDHIGPLANVSKEAIFMLVTCSAFVNYLKALAARAGLQL